MLDRICYWIIMALPTHRLPLWSYARILARAGRYANN